jgi:glycosyltransferase 2 family protein
LSCLSLNLDFELRLDSKPYLINDMSNRKTIYLGILVSLVFIYFAFTGVSIARVWLNIRTLDSFFIALSVVLILAEFILRAFRWRFLLDSNSRPKVKQLFSVLMIGYFTNNIIPLKMGELVRAQVLGTNYNVNRVQALATIVVERACDLLTLLGLFGICVLLYDVPLWIKQGGALTVILFIGALVVLYLYRQKANVIIARLGAWQRNSRLSEKLTAIMENFVVGLDVLGNCKTVVIVLVLSVVIWAVVIASIDMVLLSFSLDLSLFASVFVAVMVGLGMLLPAPPGNIGVYQGFAILALVPFGVDREAALSFSLVLHFLELAITTSIGFVCFVREIGFGGYGMIRLWPSAAK